MANVDTHEEFWGITLNGDKKVHSWDPSAESEEDIEHKIQVTQACLGVNAKDGERNLVEVTTEDDDGNKVSCAIVSLRVGLIECIHLELGFTNAAKFELKEGSGPISLSGVHLQALPLDLNEEEDSSDEDDDEEEVPELVDPVAVDKTESVEKPVEEKAVKKAEENAEEKAEVKAETPAIVTPPEEKIAEKPVEEAKVDESKVKESKVEESKVEELKVEETATAGKGVKRAGKSGDDVKAKKAKADAAEIGDEKLTQKADEKKEVAVKADDEGDEDEEEDMDEDDDEEDDEDDEEDDDEEDDEDDDEDGDEDDGDDDDEDEDDEDEDELDDIDMIEMGSEDEDSDEESEEELPPPPKKKTAKNGAVKAAAVKPVTPKPGLKTPATKGKEKPKEKPKDNTQNKKDIEKPKPTPKLNGSVSIATKDVKTPKGKKDIKKDSAASTPKRTPEEIKSFLLKSPNLPKKFDKFANYMKNNLKVTDSKQQKELWEYVQSNKK